jgi:hypothetical protein
LTVLQVFKMNAYGCFECREVFSTRSALAKHKEVDHSRKEYKCEFCDKVYIAKRALDLHNYFCTDKESVIWMKEQEERWARCVESECGTEIEGYKKRPLAGYTSENICSACGIQFKCWPHCLKHRKTIHPEYLEQGSCSRMSEEKRRAERERRKREGER